MRFGHIPILILFLAFPFSICAQQKQGFVLRPLSKGIGQTEIIGNASLEVMYAFNATDISDEQTYIDLQVLRVGDTVSKYYSRFVELNDSLRDDFIRKNPNAMSAPTVFYKAGKRESYWSEYQYTEIFTEKGEQTFYVQMPQYMGRYNSYYTEPLGMQSWELHLQQQSILGYVCQRATCHWRGRDFEAWFTADIPVGMGPWSFNGLPGLILKLYDVDKLYTWEAVGLRSGNFPIRKRKDIRFNKEKRDKVHRMLIAINKDYLKTSGAVDPKTMQPKSMPHDYEPLEKE